MKTNKEKFRVIPNLSLRGKEVQSRLKNRTLILEPNGQYSLDESFDEVRRMNKLDRTLKHQELTGTIQNLQKQLQNG